MTGALESTCLGILYFDAMRLTAAAAVVYEYVSTERCAPGALLFVSRPEPAPADCSLATERRSARRLRVGRDATSPSRWVTAQLTDRFAAACCSIFSHPIHYLRTSSSLSPSHS